MNPRWSLPHTRFRGLGGTVQERPPRPATQGPPTSRTTLNGPEPQRMRPLLRPPACHSPHHQVTGNRTKTSCLQIADHHSYGVSTVLEPMSQSRLRHPTLGGWSWPSFSEGKRSHPGVCLHQGNPEGSGHPSSQTWAWGRCERWQGAPFPSSPAAFKSAPRTALTCSDMSLVSQFTTS